MKNDPSREKDSAHKNYTNTSHNKKGLDEGW